MRDSVIIKSNQYGLTLVLNHEVDFNTLAKDICMKFKQNKNFFGEREMIISIEGRELSPDESTCIVEAIELNSDIKITLLDEHDVLKDIRMKDKKDKYYYDEILKNAKIITGSIKKGATIHSDSSICILGDVKSGATVEAAGNVIITGKLSGDVYAGYPDNKECFIVACEMETKKVTIGSVSKEFEINKKWSLRTKSSDVEPHGIIVWNNNELLCEPLRSGILKHRK